MESSAHIQFINHKIRNAVCYFHCTCGKYAVPYPQIRKITFVANETHSLNRIAKDNVVIAFVIPVYFSNDTIHTD